MKMNNLKADILGTVLDKLNDYIISKTKIEDNPRTISFTLWEQENTNGTCTYDRQEAIKWIKDNFEDLDDVVEQYHFMTGEYLNPFNNPELFMVIVFIEITYDLINEVWEDNMTTRKLYKALKTLQENN